MIVVGGPTASGKSALALALAEEFGGAVINADSMQLYRELKVLTARPDDAAMKRAPHLLYGVLSVDDPASAGRWRAMALKAIDQARRDGKLPILAGGTGLYLRALMRGIAPVPPVPDTVRKRARALHAKLGGEKFRDALMTRDPDSAQHLNAGDSQRLIRAYEVVEATGKPLAHWQAQAHEAADLRFFTILLMPPREKLRAAIDQRFLVMMKGGGLDEARRLHERRLARNLPALKAMGVPELLAHLDGKLPLDQAIRQAQATTRQYAKRQATWFRHQIPPDLCIDAQFSERFAPEIFSKIRGFLLTR